ncbi:MAG: TetR/AcrR family transcriptional regulator [Pseudobdellovibrionaceae bacterium]|jgi:AcrR family transcriptional regulator
MSDISTSNEQDARNLLLNAARVLFSQKGFEGTSTRDIARESGLNISLISYYFGGKEGLYKQLFMNFGLRIAEVIDQTLLSFQNLEMSEKNFVEEIRLIITMFIDLHEENKDMANLIWREKLEGMHHSKELQDQIFLPIGNKMSEFIDQAQRKGIVSKKIHPKMFFVAMIEGLMGYLRALECDANLRSTCPGMPENKSEIANQFTLIFTQGILK